MKKQKSHKKFPFETRPHSCLGLLPLKLVLLSVYCLLIVIWDKVLKSGLSKFCGRQPLKNLMG